MEIPVLRGSTSRAIITALEPFVTSERRSKIDQILSHRTRGIVTVLDGVSDLGNIHAIYRTVESLGLLDIHLIQPSKRGKTSNRAAQGADKWLNIRHWPGPRPCLAQLRKDGYRIYATSPRAEVTLTELDFSRPVALVFGAEKEGISPDTTEQSDQLCRLSMRGFTESFNISVAAAVALHAGMMCRGNSTAGALSARELEDLRARYYFNSVQHPDAILKRLLNENIGSARSDDTVSG